VTGLAGVAGHFLHLLREVNGVVGLSVVVVIGYVIAARRGAGATLGEGLFTVDFRSVLRLRRLRRRQAGTDRSGDGNANPAANPDPQSEVVLDNDARLSCGHGTGRPGPLA
jgi:hypothetical protein